MCQFLLRTTYFVKTNKKFLLFAAFLVFRVQNFLVEKFGFRYKNDQRKSEKAESELKVISFIASKNYELETKKNSLKTSSKTFNKSKLVFPRSQK